MKKHKKLYTVIILLVIVVLVFAINCIKICSIKPDTDDVYKMFQDRYRSENVDICILDYDSVTGASWRVEQSTNKDLENEYVCLNTICNPRLLKMNKEFELDNMAKYVVVIDKNITQTKVDNKEVDVLKAREIVITNFYYNYDELEDIRFGELTFGGKLKAVIALFVPKFRLQL